MNRKDTIDQVNEMLSRAEKYGLTTEVVSTALLNAASGSERYKDITVALSDACYDWDV